MAIQLFLRALLGLAAALACAIPSLAAAQITLAQPALPKAPAALTCRLNPRPFGPGVAKVTNLGPGMLEPGRVINVVVIQAGSSGAVYVLPSPLPPGGSIELPLTGASLLARGCVASG